MSEVRRPLAALVVAVTVMALAAMALLAPSAFGQGGSQNSCGASNPNIGVPASFFNKEDEFFEGACGYRNNPNWTSGTFPPGQYP